MLQQGQKAETKKDKETKTEWLLPNLLHQKSSAITISGNPQIVSFPYGEAVLFNGTGDTFFYELPLKSLQEFTVEMTFKLAINGVFEQRILHIGESTKDRMLLEIRAVYNN